MVLLLDVFSMLSRGVAENTRSRLLKAFRGVAAMEEGDTALMVATC